MMVCPAKDKRQKQGNGETHLARALPAATDRQGGWNGGPPPYGFDLVDGQLVVKEDEASVVRMVFDEYINGSGYTAIAAHLNRLGIPRLPTKVSHDRPFTDWSIQQIKRMLDNPVYTGRIAFGKTRQERIKGTENEYRRLKSDNRPLAKIRCSGKIGA